MNRTRIGERARLPLALTVAMGTGLLMLGQGGQAAPQAGSALRSGVLVKGKNAKPRAVNTPVAVSGYKLSVFAKAPAGFTAPDSLAVDGGHVFVGYGDKGGKTGGGTSTVAEFSSAGTLLQTFTFSGHNDGLRVDPSTHLLWSMQDEDGNPQLVIVDPVNPAGATVYSLPSANGGGGYDDIVFRGGNVYFSASNPALSPNTGSAIVQAVLSSGVFTLTPVLAGNAPAINTLSGTLGSLNLQDPDSLTVTPGGDLLLDSQGDNELVTVSAVDGSASVLPITVASGSPSQPDSNLDDTVFAGSGTDTLLIADRDSNTIYALTGLAAKQAYSAANDNNLVGTLNVKTGVVTPIVSGLNQPHGLAILHAPPTVASGYTLSVFANAPVGFTAPDSIAVDRGRVFVGYGDAGGKTGGGTSTVAEFNTAGTLLQTFTFAGHNDGLRVDPSTHLLWSMQNEDGNPQVVVVDPANPAGATVYSLPSLNGGGGYDDIVFRSGAIYLSASNPGLDPNTGSAIVQATVANGAITVAPVFPGNATATNVLTGATGPLNLQDPDSLIVAPNGDLLLDSQGDNELIRLPISGAATTVLPITVANPDPAKPDNNLDDTVFAKSAGDVLLIADRDSNTVYALTGLAAGQAYSAANDNNLVGALDFKTGIVTPVVSGLSQPHGLAVLPVLGAFQPGLQMISAPEDLSGVGLSGVLDVANLRLAFWDPAASQYLFSPTAPADALHPGLGYWVNLTSAAHLFDQGVPTATTAPFSITLQAGWNMIGDPFPTAVPLSSLSVKDGGGKSYADLNAAAGAGLASPLLYSYGPGDAAYPGGYQPQTLAGGMLAPFKGYWVRAFAACTLLVPAPAGH